MRYKRVMGRQGEARWRYACIATLATASLAGCVDKTDAEYRADIDADIHDSISAELADLVVAARALQAASPSRGWDPARHADHIIAMRAAWKRTRIAYEHVEGAIKTTFPDVDWLLDMRYEESLAQLGHAGDAGLFDGRGTIGMHAIERILFAPEIRSEVTAFERKLAGYVPAAYPATDDEAIAFKTGLVQRLIDDADRLRKRWPTAELDVAAMYRGQIGLMTEQKEKLILAVTAEEESRYSNVTLFDLRNNLDGAQKIYALFRAWVHSKAAGARSDSRMRTNFDALETAYATTPSDALPQVPAGWSLDHPTEDDLATPFGAMWQTVRRSVDAQDDHSVVFVMNQIGELLGFGAGTSPAP